MRVVRSSLTACQTFLSLRFEEIKGNIFVAVQKKKNIMWKQRHQFMVYEIFCTRKGTQAGSLMLWTRVWTKWTLGSGQVAIIRPCPSPALVIGRLYCRFGSDPKTSCSRTSDRLLPRLLDIDRTQLAGSWWIGMTCDKQLSKTMKLIGPSESPGHQPGRELAAAEWNLHRPLQHIQFNFENGRVIFNF